MQTLKISERMGWSIKNSKGIPAIHCSRCGRRIKEGKDFTTEELKAYYYKKEMQDYFCEDCKAQNMAEQRSYLIKKQMLTA